MSVRFTRSLLLPFALTALPQLAPAQCGHVWQPIQGFQPVGPGFRVRSLAQMPGNRLAVGGIFLTANAPGNWVTVYDRFTSTWDPMAGGCNGTVEALAVLPTGHLVAGGTFTSAGGILARGIARWDGTAWHAFGTGLTSGSSNGNALAFLSLPNGDLLVGGTFSHVDGVPAANIARWNGSVWSSIGTPAGHVSALALAANGDLLAGGLALQRWNGTTWSTLGIANVAIRAIVEWPGPDGGIVMSGQFFAVNGVATGQVARWEGSAWHPVGSGFQQVLDILPNGDLLLAAQSHVARWNGTTATQIGAATDGPLYRASRRSDGNYDVGGQFNSVGGQPSPLVATLATTCPASAGQVGVGCTSSAGPVVLGATTLPWIGSVCETRATGMPATSIALNLLGVNPGFGSLGALLPPYGQPGCFLRVNPDEISVLMPSGGVATATLAIPSSTTLVGLYVRQQMLPFEFSATGALTAVTASNALFLTIGSW
jgi:hypothetical protein